MNYLSFRNAVFVSTADTMEYVIKCGQEYIFRGIAVKAPGDENAVINVGEICTQYLDNQMPDFRDFHDIVTRQRYAFRKFTLFSVERTIIHTGPEEWIDEITEHAEAVFNFLYCWDYEDFTWDNEDMVLSDPVNGHLDCRMKLLYTQYGETTGATFYVTPILSARPEGSTVTADILTEYDNPSLLEVVIGNSSITIDSVSLTGVTYTTPPNTGYTYSTTAEYYYDGELVGQTQIVIAGDQGGEVTPDPPIPIDPDNPDNWDGNIYINGTPWGYSWAQSASTEIAHISLTPGFRASVTGSDVISGVTSRIGEYEEDPSRHDTIELYCIDNTQAPIGETVEIRIERDGAVTALTATVVVTNSGQTVDTAHSSWFSFDLTDLNESYSKISNPLDYFTSTNSVAFGKLRDNYQDGYYISVGGYQVFPGGSVVNDINPLIVTSGVSNNVKTITITSPYRLNGFHVIDNGSSGYTTANNFRSSVLEGIAVEHNAPDRNTSTPITCGDYGNNLTQMTVPITIQDMRRLQRSYSGVKYGFRYSTGHCYPNISVTSTHGQTATWNLETNTL